MRKLLVPLLAAALAALLCAPAALADRETAEFQAGRGDKALAAKDWEEAAEFYRRSLSQDETYLPARYGLAQALIGAGTTAAGVEELRAFVAACGRADPLPSGWRGLAAKAEKQLAEIDAAGSELASVLDRHADALAALADRWDSKDPRLAERALRAALKARPGHARSVKLLEKMGLSVEGELVELFNGRDLSGWEFANPPTWQVLDGELVGDIRDAAVTIRSLEIFEGDHDVVIEARLLEEHPGPTFYAMLPTWKRDYDHYSLGCLNQSVTWFERTKSGEEGERKIKDVFHARLKSPFDATKWNTFEMRIRGGTVTALVNGEVVGEERQPESRRGGFVGLQVQDGKFAFRKVQVLKR